MSQAVALIVTYGPGVLIAKLDLNSTYRRVPVHLENQHLLGMRWEGTVYLNCAFTQVHSVYALHRLSSPWLQMAWHEPCLARV